MVVEEKATVSSNTVQARNVINQKSPYKLAILASHPIQYQAPLFRALADSPNIDLTVFFCSDHGLKPYRDEGFGVEFKWDVPLLEGYHAEFLPNYSRRPNSSSFWSQINPAIIRQLKSRKFDAILIMGWSRATSWLALLAAISLGIPILMRGETNLLPVLPGWKKRVKQLILGTLFKYVAGFLAIGKYNLEFYRAYGVPAEKLYLAPYAVDNGFFISQAEKHAPHQLALKREIGIPETLPVILFSGKLTPVKRPMDLLKAFAFVTQTQQAALVYLGDGNLRAELEQFTADAGLQHVYFAGFHNQTELPRFFAAADIFVLPSGSEPWGLVVNEALCFGLPVIVSDQVGSSGDLVQEGVNGFTFPVGEVATLATRITQLLTDTARRRQMGRASRQLIAHWGYAEDVQAVNAFLSDLAASKNTITSNVPA